MNRRNVKGLFNPVGVVQQPVVGGVGDYRMHRPLRTFGSIHLLLETVAGKFPLRDPPENAQRVTRRLEPQRHDITHHQQMRQRLMAVAVNQ